MEFELASDQLWYNRYVVNIEDFIYVGKKKTTKRYRLSCDSCGADRGYSMKSRSDMLCKTCTHKGKDYMLGKRDEAYSQKMSKAKKGQSTWNKGVSKYTEEQRTLRNNMSSAIRNRLFKRGSDKKGESYLDVLEYSIDELKQHLEKQFLPGMSWDNYGLKGWQIDHIKPDSLFSYSSMRDKEFKECWSLNN